MKLITRDMDYAIRALCVLASRGGEIVSVDALVKKTRVPRPFLRKILQILNRYKIIKSYKGRGGGFALGKDASMINLLDIMSVFQRYFRLSECTLRRKVCPKVDSCGLRKRIINIERMVKGELKKIDLKTLAA